MVYFGSVNDATLKTFTDTVNVNKLYSLEDISSSDYWNVEDLNGVLKCIPLFHTEEITSNNPNDVILDKNKCIICENKETTVITCKGSTSPINTGSFQLYAYTLNQSNLYCIVTDTNNNIIKNTAVTVYNSETSLGTVKTNTDGICTYKATTAGTYYFKLEDNESNEVVISQ